MSSWTFGRPGTWLLLSLGTAGCFLDAEGLTPASGGGAPQGGGTGSGAGPQGGGNTAACETPSDCPAAAECSVAECNDGACSERFDPVDTPCGDGVSEVCDGSGTCLGTAGHPCTSADACLEGACADGVCCDTTCDSLCASCDQPGLEGTCTPHPAAEDPEGCMPGTCDGAGSCASGVALAADAIGTAAGDSYVIALDVADPGGDVLLTGFFTNTTNAGGTDLVSAGSTDILVARLDDTGAHAWSKRFGDASDQLARDVASSPTGDVVISGDIFGSTDFGGGALTANGRDAFLVKLDNAGNHVWSKRFGDGSEQTLNAVGVAPNGDVIAAGDFAGTEDFGGGPLTSAGSSDVAVVRLDAAGNHIWSKRFGDGNEQRVTAIAVDADGNTWLTGYFVGGGLDFGGGPLTYSGTY
ncbi:MAG: hypothetical protein JNK04_15935, partial [Myxococcales bacterium]|nr:hypothetical protein [Myxococcales bacterium]